MGRVPYLRGGVMRVCIVTPAPAGSHKGNRVTAERWARLLGDLGHDVEVAEDYRGQRCDLLVALHALKSHSSMRRFRDERPDDPLVLILTGTDLYRDIHTQPQAAESLRIATRLVLLQPHGVAGLPLNLRDKARVIYQSVEPPTGTEPARDGVFEVCVMGHLRPEKDPFRTALAADLLPSASHVKVVHLGAALSDDMAHQAREIAARNPRYEWLGELPRAEALRVLSRCRLLSLTSELEGGANVVSEAVAAAVPVAASRIAGSVGLLGDDYPGYFPVGDTPALAALLRRAESDADFYKILCDRCAQLRPLFEPARERQSLDELLRELFP
jgi:putative glycosyltransferase (TIGR04348 family)